MICELTESENHDFSSFIKLLGGWLWWVHLDYNVSSWPWFGQKSIARYLVRPGSMPGLIKSYRVGGGGVCIWIITSAPGPA